ncbi:MAG: alanine--tRNA ligase [Trueperaceae bacterium]|nr:alanine--tRNA ligase [Trueperaceae bacterium]
MTDDARSLTPAQPSPRTAAQREQADWIDDLRRGYLAFFEEKGHLRRPSAPVKSDDPTLMFTSAGMVQFKPYFLGATPKFAGVKGVHHRVTTAQKCLRINDIENVGRTLRHHSFFEMLGNFSFGDYFKREAAQWAWEYLVERLGFDPERLYVTIYLDDDQADEVWRNDVGVPADRISRWDEDENFWPANAVSEGPNGPCGPCSEVFFDRGPEYGTKDENGPNTGSGDRFIEIWNLVFTQFDRQPDGSLEPLPQENIDTGLGFERLVAVMLGAEDAYATELFQPTIREVARRSGVAYEGVDSTSHRVIADHLRAVAFAVSDGVLPANDGAGYVIKMLLRRASRHAWLLGLKEPVLHALVPAVVQAMGTAYPELADGQERIQAIVRGEEEQFLRTLEAGIQRVKTVLDDLDGEVLPGDVAFDLWQTHGFPLDLTRDLAAERGVSVDADGYRAARERARERSRGSKETGALFAAQGDTMGRIAERAGETEFLGYQADRAGSQVVAVLEGDDEIDALGEGRRATVILDRTPFYPEGGGQIGDVGKLVWDGGAATVRGTRRSPQGLILHEAEVVRGTLRAGARVDAQVDPQRVETQKHHSATHLLHAALRTVVGTHVAQAGSLVAPDRLRFDVSHGAALAADELARVETLVNRWIQADLDVGWREVPIAEARTAGAMMLFGEKYGDSVRMVTMGRETEASGAPADQAVSIELCGGTHVQRTGQIGPFLITGEEAVSAGVRRITALAGQAALAHVRELRDRESRLAGLLGGLPGELEQRARKLQDDVKTARNELAALREKLAEARTGAGGGIDGREVPGVGMVVVVEIDGLDAGSLRNAADTALSRSKADVVVLGSGASLVVKVGEEAQANGVKAGDLARTLAKRAGGGGGGRPDMAQAGAKDADALAAVLAELQSGSLDAELFGG